MIRKIIIFGGGTSGWLTAAYLSRNLINPVEIQLIEDSSAGPIGVGEGTQPFTARFLHLCGIPAKKWMKPSKGSMKYGVELTGWNKEPYFVDNDSVNNYFPTWDIPISRYFIDKPYSKFAKWHPAYRLAKSNTSPKLSDNLDVNLNETQENFGAVHFSAYDIIKSIKDIILDKITYTDTKICDIKSGPGGITKLISEDGNEYEADLYIDCTGFKSILIGETLKTPFISYNNWLLNDSAVAIPKQYTNPEEECHPYTKATTMNAGWRWTIPTYNRIGNGYVYSSKHISAEQAEQELRDSIGEYEAPANHVKMKIGAHQNIAVKNVVAVGLSAGFVEPLEATGITFTTSVVHVLCDELNEFSNRWYGQSPINLNKHFQGICTEILAFIYAHYYFSSRDDTPYWKEIRSKKLTDLPPNAKSILDQFYPKLKNFVFATSKSMFNSVQWWSMLHAGGAYPNEVSELNEDEKKYVEHFMSIQDARVEGSKKLFGNHYKFLKDWYEED